LPRIPTICRRNFDQPVRAATKKIEMIVGFTPEGEAGISFAFTAAEPEVHK
jgi:hypothetical protein